MQIVIDISEKMYEDCKVRNTLHYSPYDFSSMIVSGTPLPKGHGRLFDERDIVNGNYEIIGNRIYELEPIIEADKESEEICQS